MLGIITGIASLANLAGKVFGTDKAIKSGIEIVANGLNSLVGTDQEKAQESKYERSEARKMVVRWMEATQGQNLARRIIALVIVFIWSMMYMSAAGLAVISIWLEDTEKVVATAKIVQEFGEGISGEMMLVLGFYFAAPHLDKMVDAALTKMKGKKN